MVLLEYFHNIFRLHARISVDDDRLWVLCGFLLFHKLLDYSEQHFLLCQVSGLVPYQVLYILSVETLDEDPRLVHSQRADYILDGVVRRRGGQRKDRSGREQVSDREQGAVRGSEVLSPLYYHVALVYRHEVDPRLEVADDFFEVIILKGLGRRVYVLYFLWLGERCRRQVQLGVGRVVGGVAVGA